MLEGALRCLYTCCSPLAYRYPLGSGIAGRTLRCYQLEYDVSYAYNRCGFRDAEWEYPPSAEEGRILFLGDSFVEGQGVRVEERFTSLYAAQLNSAGQYMRILNAGQIATQPADYLANLIRFGAAFRPKIVVATLCVGNDFMLPPARREEVEEIDVAHTMTTPALFLFEALANDRRRPRRIARTPLAADFWEAYFRRAIDRDFYHDYLRARQLETRAFDAFCSRIDPAMLDGFLKGYINPSYLLAAYLNSCSTPCCYNENNVAAVAACFCRMQTICDSQHIRFLTLIIPDISQIHPDLALSVFRRWGYQELPAQVVQLANMRVEFIRQLQGRGIAFLDVTPYLQQASQTVFFPYDQHLNALGHAVVAEALLRSPHLRDWLELSPGGAAKASERNW